MVCPVCGGSRIATGETLVLISLLPCGYCHGQGEIAEPALAPALLAGIGLTPEMREMLARHLGPSGLPPVP